MIDTAVDVRSTRTKVAQGATPSRADPGHVLDDARAPLYTIGQVSSIFAAQPATLRRLEEQGLVRPERSGGRQRRYSRQDVERIREILELVDQGVTLPGVRQILALRGRVAELEDEVRRLRRGDPS